MTDNYYTTGRDGSRKRIQIGPPIAEGASGRIHNVIGQPDVVKIYKNTSELPIYRKKIMAMLLAQPNVPPLELAGKKVVQIAWPTGLVGCEKNSFVGFIMPVVDFDASTELENAFQKKVRRMKNIPESYILRARLATNLSALVAEIHAVGHHIIDMKPMNLRFYPDFHYLSIIDTDGFSINGKLRYPAQMFSDDYIAPEAQNQKPHMLGEQQDLFALAVIIFRLLNNGLHPFQGVDLNANNPSSIQERVFSRLYAYHRLAIPGVSPSRQSIHEYFEHKTRDLFDQAFSTPDKRPTAIEWREHLKYLVTQNVLVQCKVNPDHAHFSKGCGLCALERNAVRIAPAKTISATTSAPTAFSPPKSASPTPQTAPASPTPYGVIPATRSPSVSPLTPAPPSGRRSRAGLLVGVLTLSLALLFLWPSAPPSHRRPIELTLDAAPKTVQAGSGVVTVDWLARNADRCKLIPPQEFKTKAEAQNSVSGTLASPGQHKFAVECVSSSDAKDKSIIVSAAPAPAPKKKVPIHHLNPPYRRPSNSTGKTTQSTKQFPALPQQEKIISPTPSRPTTIKMIAPRLPKQTKMQSH